ncbi:MAG: DUF839 domain-containing protein [Pseudobacteriovorax sp.]|nr:DUF839 domain-containing protein [Pseudobacteriovorax sp.]
MPQLSRRSFFKNSLSTIGAATASAGGLAQMATGKPFLSYTSLKSLGPLRQADALGLRLPAGVSSKLICESEARIQYADGERSNYRWHIFPDGGATFPTPDGGWIYTSNCEVNFVGGVGAVRFNRKGQVVDAYPILRNTSRNCAGGPTPWGTWLSCEEVKKGYVFECDIYGEKKAVRRDALGRFKHEAVAIDPDKQQAYLTEDETDGRLYRFTTNFVDDDGVFDFDDGILEVAIVGSDNIVSWAKIDDPAPGLFGKETRFQVPESTIFNGGEGIWFHEGLIYFTTKGDNRVWKLDTNSQLLEIVYDVTTSPKPILSGVDNVVVSTDGHILVAEDGGDMQIVVMGPYGDIYPLVQIVDQDHSEITGPAINQYGDKIYFSSQRGGKARLGLTYELSGSFVNA